MTHRENIYESGILERYLTGDLSKQEELHVIELLERDAALRQHLTEMEASLEAMAREHAITPPSEIKDAIFSEIATTDNKTSTVQKKNLSMYLAIAAMMAFVLGSTAFWFYNQTRTLQNNIDLVTNQNKELQQNNETLKSTLVDIKATVATLNDPKTQKYILKGNNALPNAVAIAFVNTEKQIAYANTAGLPSLPEDKDYQMWADVAGEMISMGVLPISEKNIALTFIENATSINITIEPKGGNDHATVANLIANHYITP